MATDLGTQWLLADAKRLGLTLRQYEQQFNLHLMPSDRDITENEIALSDQPIEATGYSSDPASFVPYDDEHMVRFEDAGGPQSALVTDDQLRKADLILRNSKIKPRPSELRRTLGFAAPSRVKSIA